MKCKQQIGLYATRWVRYCHGKSSVRLSVVTLRYRDYIHVAWNTSKLISWLISLGFLLQRPWMTLKVIMHTASKHMCVSELTMKIWMKIDPHFQRQSLMP